MNTEKEEKKETFKATMSEVIFCEHPNDGCCIKLETEHESMGCIYESANLEELRKRVWMRGLDEMEGCTFQWEWVNDVPFPL